MSSKKIFLVLSMLFLTVACSTNKRGFGGSESEELAPSVPNYVLFNVDSSTLDSEAADSVSKQVSWLKGNEDINVIVEGHCDERGTREYNLALGAKRANAVKSQLTASGIKASRVATVSYGKERPFVQGTGAEVWAQNRRAVTAVN